MKPVSMWVTLGMSLSIVFCMGMISPARTMTKAEFIDQMRQSPTTPTATQPKPQNGMPTISIPGRANSNTSQKSLNIILPNESAPNDPFGRILNQFKDANSDPMMPVNKLGLTNDNDLIYYDLP